MNSVSWLLYIGGFGDNTTAFGAFGFIAFVIAMVSSITFWASSAPPMSPENKYVAPIANRVRWVAWPFCIVFTVIALFLPSKNTVYAIAASQVSERIITSDFGNDALTALNIWIKKQIEEKK